VGLILKRVHRPIPRAYPLLDIQILVAGQFEFWGLSEGLQVKQHGPSFEKEFCFGGKHDKTLHCC